LKKAFKTLSIQGKQTFYLPAKIWIQLFRKRSARKRHILWM